MPITRNMFTRQIATICSIADFCKNIPDTVTINILNKQIDTLELSWKSYFNRIEELEPTGNLETEILDEYNATYNEIRGKYFSAYSILETALEKLKAAAKESVVIISEIDQRASTSPKLNLPTINLPVFSGSYLEWISFRDLFITLIHNVPSIPKVTKHHYLKSSLTGEPSRLINSFAVSDINYDLAWETLNSRYNNKRVIVDSHLHALLNVKPLRHESAGELKKLCDIIRENIRALKSLEVPVETWDSILVFIFLSKLDVNSRRDFEKTQDKNILSALNDLLNFLDSRWQSLEISNNMFQKNCSFCNKSNHTYETCYHRGNNNNSKYRLNSARSNFNKVDTNICKKPDHVIPQSNVLENRNSSEFQPVTGVPTCRYCKETGHIIQECKIRPDARWNPRYNYSSNRNVNRFDTNPKVFNITEHMHGIPEFNGYANDHVPTSSTKTFPVTNFTNVVNQKNL